VETGSAITH